MNLSLNPLFVKELRGRMRGPRAFIFLTFVLTLLGLVSYGLFQLAMPRFYGFNQPNVAAGAMIGQTVFLGLVFLTLLLICAIAPSLTASAISGEHQRKTYDLLMATPLGSFTILSGKLGAALSFIVLILLAALPMTSMAYVFGGVTVTDLLKAFAVLAGFAIAFGVMGLFFSALFQRTGLAVGASYLLVGFAMLGTFFVYAVVGVMRGEQPPNWMLALNPISAMASVLVDGLVADQNTIFSGGAPMTSVLWGLSGGRFDGNFISETPLWQFSLALYTWLTILFFALATQLVKPVRRFRFGFWMVLIVGMLLMALALVALAIFAPTAFSPLRAALRWQMNPEREIVVNGNFNALSQTAWQIQDSAAQGVNSLSIVETNGKRAAQLGNVSDKETRVQTLSQKLALPLPDAGAVRLRVTFRLGAHALPACSREGATCPLLIQLAYTDRLGAKHTWAQGFYASGKVNRKAGAPPRCLSCETRPMHIKAPQEEWHTFETGDLFESNLSQDAPSALDEIMLRTAGTTYTVQIARVSVLVHGGRPLFYGKRRNNQYPGQWSVGSIVPHWLWSWVYGDKVFIDLHQPQPLGGFIRRAPIPVMPPPQPTIVPFRRVP